MRVGDARRRRWRRYWDRRPAPTTGRCGCSTGSRSPTPTAGCAARPAAGCLEVAIGTGLNLPHYPTEVERTGIELSPAMLAVARHRAADLNRDADLRAGDAAALKIADNGSTAARRHRDRAGTAPRELGPA